MAHIVPSDLSHVARAGATNPELETLRTLRDQLPEAFTVFHGAGVNHCTISSGWVQAAHTFSGETGTVRSIIIRAGSCSSASFCSARTRFRRLSSCRTPMSASLARSSRRVPR